MTLIFKFVIVLQIKLKYVNSNYYNIISLSCFMTSIKERKKYKKNKILYSEIIEKKCEKKILQKRKKENVKRFLWTLYFGSMHSHSMAKLFFYLFMKN